RGARPIYRLSVCLYRQYGSVWHGHECPHDRDLSCHSRASGGLIMPVTMLLMLDLYPAEKRGLGTSIWSMGASCGSLTGIPLGGFVAEHLSWRAAFYLILPAGIIALFIACFIPSSPKHFFHKFLCIKILEDIFEPFLVATF